MTRSSKITHKHPLEHFGHHQRPGISDIANDAGAAPSAMRRLPVLGSSAGHTHPRQQSGVLAYRRLEGGELSVLLISKRHSRKWGIPKGKAEAHLSLAANAAKEAFEEAGVRGHVEPNALGSFRTLKRARGFKIVIEVWVYLMEVTETARIWPEKAAREVKWCPPEEAALLLGEPLLADACRKLAAGS